MATVRNFDLRVRIRVSDGANSGIQYRSVHRPDLGIDVVSGYQCDVVADKSQYNGMLYEEKGRRILCQAGQSQGGPQGTTLVGGGIRAQGLPVRGVA